MIDTVAGGGSVVEPIAPETVGTDLELEGGSVGLNAHPDGGVIFSLDHTVVHLRPDGSIDVLFEEPDPGLFVSEPAIDGAGRTYVSTGNLFSPITVHVVEPGGASTEYPLGTTFVSTFEIDPVTDEVYAAYNLAAPGRPEIRRFVDGVFEPLPGTPRTDRVSGPPFSAQTSPFAVRDGSIFTVDGAQVVEFESDGTSSVIAGTGVVGNTGDGGRAIDADLGRIAGLDVHDDVMLISDNQFHVVRLVDAVGVIRTLAGAGSAGFSGDGGESSAAELDHPAAIVSLGLARFYVNDVGNGRVRLADGLVPE